MQKRHSLLLMLAVASLSACSTTEEKTDNTPVTPTLYNNAAQTRPINSSAGSDASALKGKAVVPMERLVHFEFDKTDVRAEDRGIVESNAKYLSSSNNTPVRLEGHADERGSREYNRALGERRADTVKHSLNMLGVPEQQITTLSYGEERPLDSGHDEAAWQQNRRVEMVYP